MVVVVFIIVVAVAVVVIVVVVAVIVIVVVTGIDLEEEDRACIANQLSDLPSTPMPPLPAATALREDDRIADLLSSE